MPGPGSFQTSKWHKALDTASLHLVELFYPLRFAFMNDLILSKVTYDICSCSIVIEAECGEKQTIQCDDLFELWAIAKVSEGIIEDAPEEGGVERKWIFAVNSNLHPIAEENAV